MFFPPPPNTAATGPFRCVKGQLISKCPFVVFKSPKNPSKKFPGFLPYPLKRGQINKVV